MRPMALVTVSAARCRHQRTELFEAKPRHVQPGFDGLLAEGLEQERLAGSRRPADHQVLPAVDPFQGAQRGLGGCRDRRQRRVPGGESLAGGKPRPGSAGRQHGSVPSGNLFGQKRFEHFGRVPALRLGGGQQPRGPARRM